MHSEQIQKAICRFSKFRKFSQRRGKGRTSDQRSHPSIPMYSIFTFTQFPMPPTHPQGIGLSLLHQSQIHAGWSPPDSPSVCSSSPGRQSASYITGLSLFSFPSQAASSTSRHSGRVVRHVSARGDAARDTRRARCERDLRRNRLNALGKLQGFCTTKTRHDFKFEREENSNNNVSRKEKTGRVLLPRDKNGHFGAWQQLGTLTSSKIFFSRKTNPFFLVEEIII